jgi:FkbH-like protein
MRLKIAVLATYTAEPLIPYLGVALEDAGLSSVIWIGPYNQIMQQCIGDETGTARFSPDILIVSPRLDDLWAGRLLPLADNPLSYASDLDQMVDVCIAAARRWKAALLFVLPPIPEVLPLGVGDTCSVTGVQATSVAVREAIRRKLADEAGVYVADLERTVRAVGSATAYNYPMLTVARIPFSEEAFFVLAQQITRLIELTLRPARKVVVVDGDNTLWGGVVGEEGPEGVDLADNGQGEAYRNFQAFLLELRRAGVLIALSSKNNEADVWDVFSRREMVLKKEDLAAWRINWEPKSQNLCKIANDLGLALDSFVLIDDSMAEIAEVQQAIPEVACIHMPEDPALWLRGVLSDGVLDRLPPTADDLRRVDRYSQERVRKEFSCSISDSLVYLRSLNVKVRLFTPALADIARLAQLVAKTNQFNLNYRRRDSAELRTLCNRSDYLVRLVQAEDRFGDYGTVGAFILHLLPGRTVVDTFLLSCRAMARGIEDAMIASIFEEVGARSLSDVVATVVDQPRNEPARTFFANLGCKKPGQEYRLAPVEWPRHIAREQPAVGS